MIYDIFTFNGEYDLLEIRLNILNNYIDKFIIVEFDKTFSGEDKPAYYLQQQERYKKWANKINYFNFQENHYNQYLPLAKSSPDTKGAFHWKTEFVMKESIKDTLIHLKDDDICFIGDVDEIYNPNLIFFDKVHKLKLRVYTYYLNNRSNEEFWGTIVGKYGNIKGECLNYLRTNAEKTENYCGWHFTSLKDGLRRKLTNSYTKETYANDWVMDNLDKNILENKAFLGRNFTYKVDESEWPDYLKDNREKYAHLLQK